jgi:hypothetical protein
MPSRVFSALHRHPTLFRPRRRAAEAPQAPAVEAQSVAAAAAVVSPVLPAESASCSRPARTPTCITMSSRFLASRSRGGVNVPYLRMSGHWLEQRGFQIGGNVYVEAEQGRLILSTDPGCFADA